jgi:RNA polymerase sigma-70 factor (ECF subfamily)
VFLQALEHEGVLRAFLRRYAPDPADVEELLQETYARLLGEAESALPEKESVRACVLRLAHDVVREWLRQRGVVSLAAVADLESLGVLDEGTQVASIVGTEEELARLAEAVAELPEECRRAYTLRMVYEFTVPEIAARLRLSEDQVEEHLALGVQRCAEVLFDRPRVLTEKRAASVTHIRRVKRP